MSVTGWDTRWRGGRTREDGAYPVWQLRDWAQTLGLVRKYKGELRPTRRGTALAADTGALAELIAREFPYDRLYGAPTEGL